MAWIYLLIASVFEVVFALATNATHGFTVICPSLLTPTDTARGNFIHSLSHNTNNYVVAYTVNTGIGAVGTVRLGTLIFDEEMNAGKAVAGVRILGGVLGL
ncbi:SMR family transporter, partial [Streptomyces sp. BE20]|nr:SMR family transporter [Streptomyces sp. BE20]